MNFRLKNAAAAILAASLVCSAAYADGPATPVKKHTAAKKAKTPPPPTVEEQIQALKQDLENQINGLKMCIRDRLHGPLCPHDREGDHGVDGQRLPGPEAVF